jgi:hypothetical protein
MRGATLRTNGRPVTPHSVWPFGSDRSEARVSQMPSPVRARTAPLGRGGRALSRRLHVGLVTAVIAFVCFVTSWSRAETAPKRMIFYVEGVKVDVPAARARLKDSIPDNIIALDAVEFQAAMTANGQTGPLGQSIADAKERPALFTRMRQASTDLHADGVVLVLMHETANLRLARIIVLYGNEEAPSFDELVTLDPSKAKDAAKIKAILRPELERFVAASEPVIPEPRPVAPEPVVPPAVPPGGAAKGPPGEPGGLPELNGKLPFPYTIQVILSLQLDAFAVAGRGVAAYQRGDGSGLTSGFDVRRARASFMGSFAKNFYYLTHLEFGGNNLGGPIQSFAFRGGASHAWIAYKHSDAFAVRLGQFPQPVTFENIRPILNVDFMDQSRLLAIAAPNSLDTGVMIFGTPGPFAYGLGLSNGEGARRSPVDGSGDLSGRISAAINRDGENRVRFGASGRYAVVDPRTSWSDAPVGGFTTVRGYQFWNPTYFLNTPPPSQLLPAPPPTPVSVLPSGAQRMIGADIVLQLGDFSLQAEGAYIDFGRREATRTAPNVEDTLRSGSLSGPLYYATLGYWIYGGTPALKNLRWDEPLFKLGGKKKEQPFQTSVQLLARWEQLFLSYDSTSRSALGVERGLLDQQTQRLRADILQIRLEAWMSTRFLLAGEWSLYGFPGTPTRGDPRRLDNQALAPGAVIPGERGTRLPPQLPSDVNPATNTSYFQPPGLDARFLHEFSFRAQLYF